MTVMCSDLKNIVADWLDRTEKDIIIGLEVESPNNLLEYEQNLFLCLIQLGALIMAWVLKTRLENSAFQKYAEQRIISKLTTPYKHATNQNTSVRTLFGNRVKLKLRYYVPKRKDGRERHSNNRGKNGSGIFPALDALGILFKTTPALASEVTRSVTEGPSMEAAHEHLSSRGITLDIKVIRRISEAFAATGLKIRDAWLKEDDPHNTPLVPETESFKGKRVLISTDGGRIRIRKNKRGKISYGKKRHGYSTNWREPKLIMIRTIDEEGKVEREFDPIFDGTIGGPDSVFKLLYAHLVARDIQQASQIVCAGDGALWIWQHLIALFADLDIDLSTITLVLDFYHAVEHLSKVADGRRGWNERKRRKWLKQMKSRLKQGDIEFIIDELKQLARGRNTKVVKTEIGYFEENKERMRYDDIKNKRLPLGSGAMESGIRQVVNMRLKNAGMFWNKENAEGFLHLRCYLKGKRWKIMELAVINHLPIGGCTNIV